MSTEDEGQRQADELMRHFREENPGAEQYVYIMALWI